MSTAHHANHLQKEAPMMDPGSRPVASPPRRPRHLMDPNDPRPVVSSRPGMSLTTVQMWVLSVLAVSTGLHLVAGMVGAAVYAGTQADSPVGSQVGLLILAGLLGVGSFMGGAAIHHKSMLRWWVLAGVIPSLVGAYFLFWH
jgi:hypothetical protein